MSETSQLRERVRQLESDNASLRQERNRAVDFANKIERQEHQFEHKCQDTLRKVGEIVERRPDENMEAPVQRLKDSYDSLILSEKKLSDAYLRIRTMLDAFDTAPGGTDRFEVTEKKLQRLMSFALRIHTLACTCKTEETLGVEVGKVCYSERLMLCDIARREHQILKP